MRPRRVLIFRGGALGDFILSMPLLQEIRRNWPDAHITVAGYAPARLAIAGGLAESWRSLDEAAMHALFSPERTADSALTAWAAGFDVILSLLHDPDRVVCRNLGLQGDARWVEWSPMPAWGHATDHFLQALGRLGLSVCKGLPPQLRLSEKLVRKGREALKSVGRPMLAIHPGSGSPRKNWPIDHFLLVADQARSAGLHPVFFLGEAEESIAKRLIADGWPVQDRLDLLTLAGRLGAVDGYLGNDSGVTHLAAALGLPVVALFGPTDPAVWAPRGPRVRVLRSKSPDGDMKGIVPSDVLDGLRSLHMVAK